MEIKGQLRVVVALTISDGRIAAIDAIADPEHLERLDYSILED